MKGLPRQRIDPRFRAAQAASLAGRHDDSERLFEAVAAERPDHPHLALQRALADARAGRLDRAVQWLDGEPATQGDPLAAFVRLRAARPDEVPALVPAAAAQQANRVAATVRAYGLARAGLPSEALAELEPFAGDNFEVLAWTWAELERAAAALPCPAEPPLPALPPVRGSRRAARRWFRAGLAAAYRHENVLVRRWLRAHDRFRWLAGTLDDLERLWPTDALQAFRLAQAAGLASPLLDEMLGAELLGAGYPSAALGPLTAACDAAPPAPDGQLSEEACRPLLLRAAALLDLHRWDEAEAALALLADGEVGDDSRAHEFGEPIWLALRGRLLAARGDMDRAAAALLAALEGEPILFDERLAQMKQVWQVSETGNQPNRNPA